VAGPPGVQVYVYPEAGSAGPVSSPVLLAAVAWLFPPRPGALAGVPGAGCGGCGWIPSSSVPLWPVEKSKRKDS
jgi:hypothetical protein